MPTLRRRFKAAAADFWQTYGSEFRWYDVDPITLPAIETRSVRHTLGCLLARVVGRSPLEYLSAEERERQREAVVRLIHDEPRDVPELIERFVREIEAQE